MFFRKKPKKAVAEKDPLEPEYRDLRKDLEYLHGLPISAFDKSDEKFAEALRVLEFEGLIDMRFVNGRFVYCMTQRAKNQLKMMKAMEELEALTQ